MSSAILLLCSGSANAATLQLDWVIGAILPDGSNVPSAFQILRRTADTPYAVIQTVAPTVNSALDTTVKTGVKYCYQIYATNAAGNSPMTNEACFLAVNVAGEVGVDLPTDRIVLISKSPTQNLLSLLVNNSDTVAVNDSVAAVNATVTINSPPGVQVLISRRSTDGSKIVSFQTRAGYSFFINGVSK